MLNDHGLSGQQILVEKGCKRRIATESSCTNSVSYRVELCMDVLSTATCTLLLLLALLRVYTYTTKVRTCMYVGAV
jgi:hypothetical protein